MKIKSRWFTANRDLHVTASFKAIQPKSLQSFIKGNIYELYTICPGHTCLIGENGYSVDADLNFFTEVKSRE